jgi:hypothetical protein
MRKCSRCHCTKPNREFKALKMCKKCSKIRKERYGSGSVGEVAVAWRRANAKRLAVYNNIWRKTAKNRVIKHYGDKCACCGENDIRFLTIDHQNGGGTAHRRRLKIRSGTQFYRWLERNNFPPGYAVLCFNCNCGKAVNKGVCPHQDQRV